MQFLHGKWKNKYQVTHDVVTDKLTYVCKLIKTFNVNQKKKIKITDIFQDE